MHVDAPTMDVGMDVGVGFDANQVLFKYDI